MNQIPASLLTLLAGVGITLISLWVGQHHGLLPEQASEQAVLVDHFFDVMVTIATALFFIVQGAIVWFIIQFRRRAGDETDGAPIEGNLPLEIVWTAIPAVIVIGLGIYSVDVYEQMGGFAPAHQHGLMAGHSAALVASADDSGGLASTGLDSTAPLSIAANYGLGAPDAATDAVADLVVNVTGLQYAWLFNYPIEGITTGELHVPLGKAVQLNLAAQDVIHSFWIPQFRIKQDALPGLPTELRFVATKTGTFPVVCAELCGGYHGSMRTQLIVQSPEEYEAWLATNRVAAIDSDGSNATGTQPAAIQPAAIAQTLDETSQFLAPYAETIGVNAEMLAQLQVNP